MNNDEQKEYLIKAISFSKGKKLPEPKEEVDRQSGVIKWGQKNDYPFYLIDMYNGSAWHQGIVKNKTYYIAGGGIKVVQGVLDKFLENEYTDFNIEDVIQSCAFDQELFDAFAVIGTWNKEGTRVVKWEHVDVDALRFTEDDKIAYSEDWTARRQDPEKTGYKEYDVLNKRNPQGQFIIYYKSPSKKAKGEQGIYPKPPYVGGITAINTDVLISKYHFYEIQNGFKGGTLVNLANGVPDTEEEARAHRDAVKGSTTSIEDTNEVIITFSDGQDGAPTVLQLNGNDLADRYNLTEKSVQQNILVAHSATNPVMFGIIQEGSFNAAESQELFEIFVSTYVETRQKTLNWLLNEMASLSGFEGSKMELITPDPFDAEVVGNSPSQNVDPAQDPELATVDDVSGTAMNGAQISSLVGIVEAVSLGTLTPNAAVEVILASFPTIDRQQAEKIVGVTPGLTSEFRSAENDLKVFAEYGQPKSKYKALRSFSVGHDFSSKEVEKLEIDNFTMFFDKIGDIRSGLTDLDKNVLKLLKEGEDGSSITKALDEPLTEVAKSINKLEKLNLLVEGSTSSLGNQVLEGLDVTVDQFEVRYSYEVKPGFGAEVISTSRDFCKELIRQDRMYLRSEIDTISNRIGRDVWVKRGGFYHNPDTGRTTPWCRHEWVQHLVIKQD